MHQSAYVLCRLFKKQDETLEGSNCEENDRTKSTPTTANNYSPEEIHPEVFPTVASPSLATEDDKNSEEATSNVITPTDCNGEECNTCDVQNKFVIPTTAEVRWVEVHSIISSFYVFHLLRFDY